MGKCNPVHPGKCNLKHRHSKGGRILESNNAERDLRVKLDMNLQCDLTAWPASAVVLYRDAYLGAWGSSSFLTWVWPHQELGLWSLGRNWKPGRAKERGESGLTRSVCGQKCNKNTTQHFSKASNPEEAPSCWIWNLRGWLLCTFSPFLEPSRCEPQGCPRLRKSADLGLCALSWLLTLAGSLQTPVQWEGLEGPAEAGTDKKKVQSQLSGVYRPVGRIIES